MSVSHATEQDGLQVLTSGPLPPSPADLLGSQRLRAVLKRLGYGEDDESVMTQPSPPKGNVG